ncbi:MAG: IS1595 family transposase [Ferruginibacter sp.]
MNFTFKTIHEFNDYFRDEKTCYEFFENLRWNGVPVCPHCGSKKYYKVPARGKFKDIPTYRCGNRQECDLTFSVRTKSIFEGSKVEFRKWLLAAYEISTCKKGISSIELATRIGTSQKTAWFINHRLRTMLKETNPKLLTDVVALDETLIGGKNKNKHGDKKIPHSQGRSSKGKTMVFGARGLLGEIRTKVIASADAETIVPIVNDWVEKGAIMVTDEWGAYNALKQDYFHVNVNHSQGQYVSGCFTSNGVENFWSLFKRGVIGTFHNISPQHIQLYCDEFAYRYNLKSRRNDELFNDAIRSCSNKRITYKELTKGLHFPNSVK